MAKVKQEAQNPLILRCHRLMEAFAKSDDERDFYIDRQEGFLIYVDLDKTQEELSALQQELNQNSDRYCPIPKLTFYETKKIMEGFVNEKVYDIDTKEKLLDIIQSKEARENFLEFIYDHHSEQEKWQQFYQERSRIRIIEWLRLNHFHFVFEEDLELLPHLIEKLKQSLFQTKVAKEIQMARKTLVSKAKMYYSNEALNPRPKRGRPPKQAVKAEIEPQVTVDVYTTIVPVVRPFLFAPEINLSSAFSVFSSKFEADEEQAIGRSQTAEELELSLSQKLASLRALSSKWVETPKVPEKKEEFLDDFEDDEDEDEEDEPIRKAPPPPILKPTPKPKVEMPKEKIKGPVIKDKKAKKPAAIMPKPAPKVEKPKVKRIMPRPLKEPIVKKKEEPGKKRMAPLKKIIPRKK